MLQLLRIGGLFVIPVALSVAERRHGFLRAARVDAGGLVERHAFFVQRVSQHGLWLAAVREHEFPGGEPGPAEFRGRMARGDLEAVALVDLRKTDERRPLAFLEAGPGAGHGGLRNMNGARYQHFGYGLS